MINMQRSQNTIFHMGCTKNNIDLIPTWKQHDHLDFCVDIADAPGQHQKTTSIQGMVKDEPHKPYATHHQSRNA